MSIEKDKSKVEIMTGKIQLRQTFGIFGRKKLILQVQMSGYGFLPESGEWEPYTWWVDATIKHIRQMKGATLQHLLTDCRVIKD